MTLVENRVKMVLAIIFLAKGRHFCNALPTPVLLSASVSNNSGNSPQMAAPRRSHEIDQSKQRFHVGCNNRCG